MSEPIYDGSGYRIGTINHDGNGGSTVYDSSGNKVGFTANGTTYDSSGNVIARGDCPGLLLGR